mmetsp:Transcript_4260/g.8834  ORF Transcript_4260/g.8834 Transcript_4260/m.8834 type:complete len:215 (+) Transcript_4260:39-683(+)
MQTARVSPVAEVLELLLALFDVLVPQVPYLLQLLLELRYRRLVLHLRLAALVRRLRSDSLHVPQPLLARLDHVVAERHLILLDFLVLGLGLNPHPIELLVEASDRALLIVGRFTDVVAELRAELDQVLSHLGVQRCALRELGLEWYRRRLDGTQLRLVPLHEQIGHGLLRRLELGLCRLQLGLQLGHLIRRLPVRRGCRRRRRRRLIVERGTAI